jgi:hypothetical protein
MASGELTLFERIFGQRLRHALEMCDLKIVELAREYSAQYHVDLSPSVASYWLNGKRRISPSYYSGIKTLLAAHLKMAATANFPEYGLEQELMDWDGLAYNDEQLKRERKRPRPIIIGNLPRSSPGMGHFYREEIRDDVVFKLLNPNPHTGEFQPGIVVLTGLPGSGKTEMVMEVLERAAWFFNGGILYADMNSSFRTIWQEWDRRRVSRAQVLQDIEGMIGQKKGRWLLIVENIREGRHLQSILPQEDIWVLATTYGISTLQLVRWEPYSFPMKPLTEEETILWLRTRLREQWGRPHDVENARELHRLTEGLPMATAILSALVRSRGWQKVFDALRDTQRAVSYIRFGSIRETRTSSLTKTIDLAFQTLHADEKAVLRELAMYPPGNSVPEEIFHHFTHRYEDVVDGLVEKGLLNRFESPRWRKTVLRLHRLVALHARSTIPVDKGKLLARMIDFSSFFHVSLPDGPVLGNEVFNRLYAQREMLNFAHEFWLQLGEETKAGRFEPTPDVVSHLNISVRTCAYLTWMNSGAEAAFSYLESMRQMPFILNYPHLDMPSHETRTLWADIMFALRFTDKVARNGQKVTDLYHPEFYEMGQAARSGDVVKLLSLHSELFFYEREEPKILRFLWMQQSLRMLFRYLWSHQQYSDLQLLVESTLPFFTLFPWRAGMDAHWYDFKVTLASKGQAAAEEKLGSLREYEQKFQEAFGQVVLPYTNLGEVLLSTALGDGMVSNLRDIAIVLRRKSFTRVEKEIHRMVDEIVDGRFEIQPKRYSDPPSDQLLLMSRGYKKRLNEFVVKNIVKRMST